MASPHEHIIDRHPAGRAGFEYFYIAYVPGEEATRLKLRYRRQSDDPQQITMKPLEMMAFLSKHRDAPSEEWPFEVTDPAVRIFNNQLRRWRDNDQLQ